MYSKFGISKEIIELSKKVEKNIKYVFEEIENNCEYNSFRISG